MSSRSWLAKAKSIHDIGGMYYEPKGGEPWDTKRDARAEQRWDQNFKRPLPVPESDKRYYGCRMHDSWILGLSRTSSQLRVSVNSIMARDFAYILCNALDIPYEEAEWPVDLVLHDPMYVRVAMVDRTGGLRFANLDRLQPTEEGSAELLYDWFFEQDDRLQWIAQFWDHRQSRKHRVPQYYLMVDCARATAEDRCGPAIEKAYGPAAQMLFEEAVFGEGDFDLWNENGLRRSMPERLKAHNLTRADFRYQQKAVN